jgi:hypothetical protein
MKKWIRYSRNPEERVMLLSTKHSSPVNCLNCGRLLRSEPYLLSNDSVSQFCPCGYDNIITFVEECLWEVRLKKVEPEGPNGKRKLRNRQTLCF